MTQRILAVDDEPHMLTLLERIINEKTPYEIETTNNALEIPQRLDQGEYDLIIVDLKMPGMDGLDVLREVRERQRQEEVIIITAFGSLDTAVEALNRGVFDYIAKPFKKEQIIHTVDRAMRWQRTRREAERMGAVFAEEPFDKARRAFEREYVKRLSERCGGDRAAMARASDLSPEAIAAALGE